MNKFSIITLLVSIGLFVAGFIVPPTGVIDPSVLKAGGILAFSMLIGQLPLLLDKKKQAKITHGNTSVEIK